MGEPPLFTTRAQVFQIDPKTKKIWVPLTQQAVAVSYFYDVTRNSYRIISVDKDRVIIHSTITPNMTFTKTSQRFGHWADHTANTMFGLGFASDQQLKKFAEKFQEAKEAARLRREKSQEAKEAAQLAREKSQEEKETATLAREKSQEQRETSNYHGSASRSRIDGMGEKTAPPAGRGLGAPETLPSAAQLGRWELELQTLRHSNSQLSAALQDAVASVGLWKKQVCACREENERLRRRIEELEEQRHETEREREGAALLRRRTEALEAELRAREAEVRHLRARTEALAQLRSECDCVSGNLPGVERYSLNLEGEAGPFREEARTAPPEV